MVDLREKRLNKWNYGGNRWTTQDDLARAVGCSRVNISSIEAGKTKPSVELAKKIGDFLGFDWKEFFE